MRQLQPLPHILAAEVAAHRRSACLGGGKVREFGPLVAAYVERGTPLDTAWHDGTRMPTGDEWAAFEAWCAEHGLPCMVKAMSPAMPALMPQLTARGYVPQYLLHVYAHDLQTIPNVSDGADVEPADDAQAWAQVAAGGFGPDTLPIMQGVAQAAGQRFWARLVGAKAWQATGAYTLLEGVAAFHGAATLPAARGRGLQTALLAARLRAARADGAAWASVSALPGSGSERNVGRVGFRLAAAQLCFAQAK